MVVKVNSECSRGLQMRSSTFAVGGHDWRILCYPKGHWCDGHISLFLEHGGRRASHKPIGDIMAKIQFSILDQALEPSYTKTILMQRYGSHYQWGGFEWFMTDEDFDKEKHLKDDCLTVVCDLTVIVTGTDECMEIPPVAPPLDLHGQLAEAIWDKETPDVEIKVGRETFTAHRWILENLRQHRSSTSVQDMDPEVSKALLQFIYTDSPPHANLLEAATTAERLLVAADRYELEKLKLVCEEALCRHIGMGSVFATLALAERHRCPVLKEACMRFLSSSGNLETVIAMDGF
nr:BTB/POZ and MATH domain-containing protein 3-like [Aegilops tauschii subsp. strangulata]